jgi:hypothetical protein
MTTSDEKISLSEVFGTVFLTRAEAGLLLATLARDLRDVHDGLYQALMDASTSVNNPPPARSAPSAAPSTSKASTSS